MPREVFDEARTELSRILENGALVRFRRTKEYADFERRNGAAFASASSSVAAAASSPVLAKPSRHIAP